MINPARAIGSPAPTARWQNPSSIAVSLLPASPAAMTQSAMAESEVISDRLSAFRIVATRALVAVLAADEGRLAAFWALPQARTGQAAGGGLGQVDDLRHPRGLIALLRRQEADLDHVPLDDVADRGEQRRHIAALHPRAATRVEYRLHLLDDKGDVAAAAEHRADHPGQRDGPGVMLHVLRVDEYLERPASPVLHHVVDRDLHRVVGFRPIDLVGLAGERLGPR